eukprot:scaffold106071_cov26-Tisochrysis_lutea.AAC.1
MQGFGSEEQLGICKDASAGAADSARDEEVANRAATDAAVAAAQQLGTPRTASGLRAKQQQEGDEANIGPGAVTEAESNTERLSQDRLAALTSSVADIGRAAAAFDLGEVLKLMLFFGLQAKFTFLVGYQNLTCLPLPLISLFCLVMCDVGTLTEHSPQPCTLKVCSRRGSYV